MRLFDTTTWSMALHDLLAQSRIQSLTEGFFNREFGASSGLVMLAALSVALLTAGLVYVVSCVRQRRHLDSNIALFNELAHSHGLSRIQRHFLKRMAKETGLSNPCLLFVDPTRWSLDEAMQKKIAGTFWKGQYCMLQRFLFEAFVHSPGSDK